MTGAIWVVAGWWLAWVILAGVIVRPARLLIWRTFRRAGSTTVDGDILGRTPNSGNTDDTKIVRYRFTDTRGRVRIARASIPYTATLPFDAGDTVSVTYCRYDPALNFPTAFEKAFLVGSLGRLAAAAIVAGLLVCFWPQVENLMSALGWWG